MQISAGRKINFPTIRIVSKQRRQAIHNAWLGFLELNRNSMSDASDHMEAVTGKKYSVDYSEKDIANLHAYLNASGIFAY